MMFSSGVGLLEGHCHPHDDLVDDQTADAEKQKHQELFHLVGIPVGIKHKLDAQNVIHDHGNREGTTAGNQVIDLQCLRQEHHDPVINKET